MATYVNDLRLKEITTGDESGTWGTSTNTNLELIAEAFSYGTEAITTNADTHTTTIADGASNPGRALYLKYTGTLDSACTITIGPDTVSKVWIIENGTSGSQNIIISQGSGADITIPAGDTKVVYSDGAGAGAAFFDAFASLSVVDLKVQDDLTVTGDITGTLATAAQTNITSVGSLTALDVAGTATINSFLQTNSADYQHKFFLANGTTGVGYIYSTGSTFQLDTQAAQPMDLLVNGTSRLNLGTTGSATFTPAAGGHAVFNEGGIDADFRVESDNNANMLFVDGGGDGVGIGTNVAGNSTLEVRSTGVDGTFVNAIGFQYSGNSNEANTISTSVSSTAGNSGFKFNCSDGGGSSGKTSVLKITRADMVVNDDSYDYDFRVESNDNENMLFVDGGNNRVGIGKAAASQPFEVGVSSVFDTAMIVNETGGDHDFRVESDAYVSCLQVNAAENAVNFHKSDVSVSTSGFSIGIPSAGVTSSMPSGNTYHVYRSDGVDNGYKFYVNFGGQINSTFTSITSLSDERLKENIVDLETGLSEVMALKPRRFDWKNSDNKNVAGFIAQEVETVLPDLIGDFLHDDLADAKSVKMGDMVPTLVKAIQEQQELIKTLEARITALES
jgi:hypothetical protein